MQNPTIDIDQFAQDLGRARQEATLSDLTEEQWVRVCNRIANCLHQQIYPLDWDEFMKNCGCPVGERS